MPTKKPAKTNRPPCKRVTFRVEAEPDSNVRLAGSFNGWNPDAHVLIRRSGNGTYAATLLLPVGRHEYKFLVNDEWRCDPAHTERVPNGHGTLNSVIEVR